MQSHPRFERVRTFMLAPGFHLILNKIDGTPLLLIDPRDQKFIRRTMRDMISKRRDEIARSAALSTYPFVVDINFRSGIPTIEVCSTQEDLPGCCNRCGTLPQGWDDALSRVKDGVLVV